jgi:hypothetical protein
MDSDTKSSEKDEFYEELVKEKAPYLFCDACGFYPIEPVHGHFVCPSCYNQTRCCEGAPIDV